VGPVTHTRHGDVGQPDQQRAHARRLRLQQRLLDSAGVSHRYSRGPLCPNADPYLRPHPPSDPKRPMKRPPSAPTRTPAAWMTATKIARLNLRSASTARQRTPARSRRSAMSNRDQASAI
jgi:hypothetical protein